MKQVTRSDHVVASPNHSSQASLDISGWSPCSGSPSGARIGVYTLKISSPVLRNGRGNNGETFLINSAVSNQRHEVQEQ